MIRDKPSDKSWYETRTGIGIMLLYVALTFGGLLLTLGVGSLVPAAYQVPGYVYMFTTLGVMGYVFTMLITDFERRPRELLKAGIRLPAAWLLTIGVYLLSSLLTTLLGVSEVADPVVAGMTFLVGLYVNLTYKQLGAFARKLYPGEPKSSEGGSRRKRQNGSASEESNKTVEIAADRIETFGNSNSNNSNNNNNSDNNSNNNSNDDSNRNDNCKDSVGEEEEEEEEEEAEEEEEEGGSGSDGDADQDSDQDSDQDDDPDNDPDDDPDNDPDDPDGPDSPGSSDGFESQAVMDSAVSLGEAVSNLVGRRGRIPAAFHGIGATMNDVVREQREADRVVTRFEAATDAVMAAQRTGSVQIIEREQELDTLLEATEQLNDAAAEAVRADDWDPETFEALGQELDDIGRQLCAVAREGVHTQDNDIDSAAVVQATDRLGESVAAQVGGEAGKCITESFHALGDRLSDVLHNQREADAVLEALQNANEAVTDATGGESGDGGTNN